MFSKTFKTHRRTALQTNKQTISGYDKTNKNELIQTHTYTHFFLLIGDIYLVVCNRRDKKKSRVNKKLLKRFANGGVEGERRGNIVLK